VKLGRPLFLFVAVSLVFAALISVSARRAVHAVLSANLQAAARAQEKNIVRSLAVGMRPGGERLLEAYLQGCLGGFGAAYAVALDANGVVLASSDGGPAAGRRVSGFGEGSRPQARESVVAGAPVVELNMPAANGSLLLGFGLVEVLRAERTIARRLFVFTGATAGLALAMWAFLTRELSRREEQLRQADKLTALGRLAAGIAHEINNPLGSILGFAQAAAARLTPADALMPALKGIEEEALRCRTLVQSLLSFSRDARGLAEEFELAGAVEGTVAMIEAQARAQGVTIFRELAAGLRAVGDRGQIQQVVMNLCTNAVDAMPDGGRLTLRTGELKDGTIFLEVEDEGTGIPKDIRARIFDPFFTTKDVGKGTGLGLSLVHEIVVRHNGAVEALFPRSRGSLFRVTLPRASPA